MSIDNWIALGGLLFTVLAAAVVWGAVRQKVIDLGTRMDKAEKEVQEARDKATDAAARMPTIALAIEHLKELLAEQIKHMQGRSDEQVRYMAEKFGEIAHEQKNQRQLLMTLTPPGRRARAED